MPSPLLIIGLFLCGSALAQDHHSHPPADLQAPAEPAPADAAPFQEPEKTKVTGHWGANHFPNVELTNHRGEKVRFFDDLIEGKTVMVNFIYTTCADTCPLETARLTEVAQILGDRIGDDIFFYSITIDPDRDTPEVLAKYREQFGVGEGWDFLTGSEDDILLLRKKLGLYVAEEDKVNTDHNVNLLLGNQTTGQWMRRTPFDNAYALAAQIGSRLGDFRVKRTGTASFEEAPITLPNLSRAENLFASRCDVCHRIGVGDGRVRIGPNLLNVTTRREKKWLQRWLLEPDVVLAEGDPIAIGLRAAYNDVPMPNLGLSEGQAAMLVGYLETESRRVAKVEGNAILTELKDKPVMECCEKDELGTIAGKENIESEVIGDPQVDKEKAPKEKRRFPIPFWLGGACALAAVMLQKMKR